MALIGPPRAALAPSPSGNAPSPWLTLLVPRSAFAFLVLLIPVGGALAGLHRGALVVVPMAAAIGVAVLVTVLVRRWHRRRGWNDRHLLGLVSGALIGHTLAFVAAAFSSGAAEPRRTEPGDGRAAGSVRGEDRPSSAQCGRPGSRA